MKPIIVLFVSGVLLAVPAGFGQQPVPQSTVRLQAVQVGEPPHLTKFNLDFRGGTPADLLKAIEKGLGKPLNAIVPDECADTRLPALKMVNVDVAELFQALEPASAKTIRHTSPGMPGMPGSTEVRSAYSFRTRGTPSDESVWYFVCEKPNPPQEPPKACRFYNLSPYLETFKIDDITTAIQTGWKMLEMLDQTSTPDISFHKDTKLLIAVGNPEKLSLIDSVLRELSVEKKSTKATGPTVGKGVEAPKQ